MKRLLSILALATAACGAPDATPLPAASGLDTLLEIGPAFTDSAATRREALEASIVNVANGYSQVRLANYGRGGEGWDALPVRNFAVRPVVTADIGAFRTQPYRRTAGSFSPVFDDDAFDWSHESLLELGQRAFHEYPLELSPRFLGALESTEDVDATGLWRHDDRVGGLVRVRLTDGSEALASTCSSCHASMVDGELVDGRANAAIDNSAMSRRYLGLPGSDWGPGRADVTADDVVDPLAIPDLRPIRFQKRLHWAATLYNSPEALAVRVETLMITSANQAMRPPREVAVALAYYLWSMGEDQGGEPPSDSAGARLFDRECGACHGLGGVEAVSLEAVGTDPLAGQSVMRGTGTYRVPSLRGVGDRSPLLHDGSVGSLEELLTPGHEGHEFGTGLKPSERADLLAYLGDL